MAPLADHVYEVARNVLAAIPTEDRSDIYVVSLFVYDQDDDPRKPTVTVGYNSEADVAKAIDPVDPFPADGQEARWNYAFWRQNQLSLICDTEADAEGARLREAWARAEGLWYDLAEDEDPVFNERGKPLTSAFISLLEEIVARLHSTDIEEIFGRRLPVLIHELEYYDDIAEQNLRANPAGVVPDDFVRWCRGEWLRLCR
jgi:hypothetical protein